MLRNSVGAIIALCFLCFSNTAFAQMRTQLEGFEPLSTPSSILNVHTSRIAQAENATFSVFTHYANSPYTLRASDKIFSRPIEHRITTELSAALAITPIFELSLALPIIYQSGDIFQKEDYNGVFLADTRITPKLVFLNSRKNSGFGLGIALPFYLPTSSVTSLTGQGKVRVEPRIFLDYGTIDFNLALNLGYQGQPLTNIHGYILGNKIRTSLAARKAFSKLFGISASVFADINLEDARDEENRKIDELQTPQIEGVVAGEFSFTPNIAMKIGGGMGITTSVVGIPLYRGFLGLSFQTSTHGDSDGDGIADSDDNCPSQAEDMDNFEDMDGCPELDNDNDGIPDEKDSCIAQAEDIDGFVDSDGCPDPDNDQDGILDENDKCPNKAGLESNNGCPHDLGKLGGDNPEISKSLKKASTDIQHCYRNHLLRFPNAVGKIVIRFTIGKSGKVVTSSIMKDTLKDGKVGTCVSSVIRRIQFSPPKNQEATIERTFIFDGDH